MHVVYKTMVSLTDFLSQGFTQSVSYYDDM